VPLAGPGGDRNGPCDRLAWWHVRTPSHAAVSAGTSSPLRRLLAEIGKFGTVGVIAYVVDIGAYNLLVFSGGTGPLHDKPLTAKTVSTLLAMVVAYIGNRQWTFRAGGRHGVLREVGLFVLANLAALAVTLLPLAMSRYVLDLRGPVADNISANVIGVGLGTIFRFWAYRSWVFPPARQAPGDAVAAVGTQEG
jgi:putative flippase GtrA